MTTSLFELFQRGGPVMWPILLCSILAFSIVFERLYVLFRIDNDSSQFMEEIKKAIQARQIALVERLCNQNPSPLSSMIKAGIQRYGRPRAEIREAMQEAGSAEVPHLERHVPLLGTIAHVAPLLGLLGTVTGLVRCFQIIQMKATSINPVNPGDLAGGIWEALLTTAFGLIVGVVAYGFYNYFVNKVGRFVFEMEMASEEFLDLVVSGKLEDGEISSAAGKGKPGRTEEYFTRKDNR